MDNEALTEPVSLDFSSTRTDDPTVGTPEPGDRDSLTGTDGARQEACKVRRDPATNLLSNLPKAPAMPIPVHSRPRKSWWLLLLALVMPMSAAEPTPPPATPSTAYAVFGGGCFWCLDAAYRQVPGVTDVVSGYAAGTVDHPTYHEVCGGDTGHAEVVKVIYDPTKVTYQRLIALFWRVHDPTTVDRQGHDIGPQYRSIVLTTDADQQRIAETSKAAIEKILGQKVATQIATLAIDGPARFHPAEAYHQDYYRRNPDQGYCQAVIRPKLNAFLKKLSEEP